MTAVEYGGNIADILHTQANLGSVIRSFDGCSIIALVVIWLLLFPLRRGTKTQVTFWNFRIAWRSRDLIVLTESLWQLHGATEETPRSSMQQIGTGGTIETRY